MYWLGGLKRGILGIWWNKIHLIKLDKNPIFELSGNRWVQIFDYNYIFSGFLSFSRITPVPISVGSDIEFSDIVNMTTTHKFQVHMI